MLKRKTPKQERNSVTGSNDHNRVLSQKKIFRETFVIFSVHTGEHDDCSFLSANRNRN